MTENLDLAKGTFSLAKPTATATVGRLLPDGSILGVRVEYAVVGGKAVYQGDISLGPADAVARSEATRRDDKFAFIVPRAGETWPAGNIPFVADAATTPMAKAVAAYFAQRTPMRLAPYAGENDFVSFESGPANHSSIGRQGGPQTIQLSADATLGTAVHETCHALGLWHEQCRPDRDEYVTVLEANIISGYAAQFDKQTDDAVISGNYDYGSIMHYPGDAFARAGTQTIVARGGAPIGQRNGLSEGDLAGLRALYPALPWP